MEQKMPFYVWVTKYALTKGIQKIKVVRTASANMVKPVERDWLICFHGKEWHMTWEVAKSEAIRMRTRAIISAQNKVKRLENLTFKEGD